LFILASAGLHGGRGGVVIYRNFSEYITEVILCDSYFSGVEFFFKGSGGVVGIVAKTSVAGFCCG